MTLSAALIHLALTVTLSIGLRHLETRLCDGLQRQKRQGCKNHLVTCDILALYSS